ncbi:DUF4279 domain-containing protein [Vallitalea maricola]|uniref:Uncharacterized protein n=1 Tax=Vallitalea maricola TaxID=3074433 RepID=A0ACB5UG09_9FIRM|nr:hypothetical protein AN2V17_06140 [Vallitalea sp. AN17-2]
MSTSINIEFVISGEVFDLNTITYKLELQPTEQWLKGDNIYNRNITRKDTCWTYSLGEVESLDVNDELSKIIEILLMKKHTLHEIKRIFDVDYLFLITVKIEDEVKPIISIKSQAIELMNYIGAEFDIDMYIY